MGGDTHTTTNKNITDTSREYTTILDTIKKNTEETRIHSEKYKQDHVGDNYLCGYVDKSSSVVTGWSTLNSATCAQKIMLQNLLLDRV